MPYYRSERFRPSLPHDTTGTNFIIVCNAISFILIFLRILPGTIYDFLVSTSSTVWRSPWTFFTYPLISRSGDAWKLLSLIFAFWWLFVVGGLLERSWGTRKFLTVFFSLAAVFAFFISVGASILNMEVPFGELIGPLVCLTVVWAMLDPGAPVIFFVFPMQLRWLALITCLMLVVEFGTPSPLLGFFALGGPVVAYNYARYLRNSSNRPRSHSTPYQPPKTGKIWSWLNPFEWYRRWKFKRRFKRLWGE